VLLEIVYNIAYLGASYYNYPGAEALNAVNRNIEQFINNDEAFTKRCISMGKEISKPSISVSVQIDAAAAMTGITRYVNCNLKTE
jgi:hypothetical protein